MSDDSQDVSTDTNAVMLYECSEKYVGIYYDEKTDGEIVFQSLGDTREEAMNDMMETLNYLPQALVEVQEGEAELVDFRPLKRSAVGDGDE